MPRSMTGYGRCILARDGREVTLELKSVNHRFLDIAFRMPRSFAFLESELRARMAERLTRGHVDVFISYKNTRADARQVRLDGQLLNAYLTALRAGGSQAGLDDDLCLRDVLNMQDVLSVEEAEEDQEALSALVYDALDAALASLAQMRTTEGAALQADVMARLERLETLSQEMDARAPEWLAEYREKLRARIDEICSAQLDETRLAQEVALTADRAAIDEETVRLRSHISQMRALLASDEPTGRKLDFLVQEMNREVNTTGSKSSDIRLTNLVVEAKSEIEKIREQIQNIE
ncbi:MAG TPA: YicC family protein [Candidatus Fimadaptatus faecigallinarum]|uniref:YicC family protein n=1 Tax=Candidatus Fimadaptatus faecigallinarum TaxID=2840814 RepID=A0A9D1LQ03_9FIRM|nr:YicC family protein [Candidatus Fimadaptatus faecigallinarum]